MRKRFKQNLIDPNDIYNLDDVQFFLRTAVLEENYK
jgi:hypothetical protein